MNARNLLLLLLFALPVFGQDADEDVVAAVDELEAAADDADADTIDADTAPQNGDGIESPKAMSGMSILGNEEAPKSLVIIPWKSSELGETLSLSDSLDDRARPVDKEVFLRELEFYEIRTAEK